MDSLFATYASSDEEDEQQPLSHKPQPPPQLSSKPSSALFSTLPKPQSSPSSSAFSSLPPPKSSSNNPQKQASSFPPKPTSSSSFLSLPAPKSQTTPNFSLPPPNPKRVVQFHPPVPPPSSEFNKDDDFDDDEEEEDKERKKKTQVGHDTSVKSFLSTIPAPKNSGSGALGASGGRRSVIETPAAPVVSVVEDSGVNGEVGVECNVGNGQESGGDGSHLYNYQVGGEGNHQGYGNYEGYESYGQPYDSSWYSSSSGEMVPETSSVGVESFVGVGGKRRRDQPPPEIVEVKQDELMKNRPTEDKSKLTGIAFGPAYQPATSKGKPSKLHKRKHQIGALYFDMRQKEMELAERRAKGFLTKAETQAKYGW